MSVFAMLREDAMPSCSPPLTGVPHIETDEDAERLFGPEFRGIVSFMQRRYPPSPIYVPASQSESK